MIISSQQTPSTDDERKNNCQNVEYYSYLCSMITNDAGCAGDIKSRIATAKAAFYKKKALFTRKLGLHLRKKLIKCYMWGVA
jgi:hypothetical protein